MSFRQNLSIPGRQAHSNQVRKRDGLLAFWSHCYPLVLRMALSKKKTIPLVEWVPHNPSQGLECWFSRRHLAGSEMISQVLPTKCSLHSAPYQVLPPTQACCLVDIYSERWVVAVMQNVISCPTASASLSILMTASVPGADAVIRVEVDTWSPVVSG